MWLFLLYREKTCFLEVLHIAMEKKKKNYFKVFIIEYGVLSKSNETQSLILKFLFYFKIQMKLFAQLSNLFNKVMMSKDLRLGSLILDR